MENNGEMQQPPRCSVAAYQEMMGHVNSNGAEAAMDSKAHVDDSSINHVCNSGPAAISSSDGWSSPGSCDSNGRLAAQRQQIAQVMKGGRTLDAPTNGNKGGQVCGGEGEAGGRPAVQVANITHRHHDVSDCCQCPMCLLNAHIVYLFSNQRRASLHVMRARPSAYYSHSHGELPELPPVYAPGLESCPVFAAYGFCPYGSGCYLPHITMHPALVPPAGSAEAEVDRLEEIAHRRLDEAMWGCDVCGYAYVDENSLSAVGETFYYRSCPQCSLPCYFPYITYLVEDVVTSVGDDYQQLKTLIDEHRKRLPDEFKVPLMYEAHRVASVVFAWSLVSPTDARDAMEAVFRALPDVQAVFSMGSGGGYVEHVFNRVMNVGVDSIPRSGPARRAYTPSKYSPTSFDGVRVSFFGKRTIPIYACDEHTLQGTYSVHVSMGGPLSVLSMDCSRTALLLCWPPFGSPQEEQTSMGFETLEYYTQHGGAIVIYIGDVASTGDWRFHQLLHTHYQLVRDYPVRRELRRWCPQEMGLVYAGNDTIGVYRRRTAPVMLPQSWVCGM